MIKLQLGASVIQSTKVVCSVAPSLRKEIENVLKLNSDLFA